MKVTMEQIVDFRNSSDFFISAQVPLVGAYKINKIRRAADREFEFYREKFQEIVNKYAMKDKDGNVMFSDDGAQIRIQQDKIQECNDELEALQTLEVEVDNYGLTLENLGNNIECTPAQLEALMPFFS